MDDYVKQWWRERYFEGKEEYTVPFGIPIPTLKLREEWIKEWEAEKLIKGELVEVTQEEIEKEIGDCSEIINKALRLSNAPLRNKITKHVGDYRQLLREKL